jgi:hypothetical protein
MSPRRPNRASVVSSPLSMSCMMYLFSSQTYIDPSLDLQSSRSPVSFLSTSPSFKVIAELLREFFVILKGNDFVFRKVAVVDLRIARGLWRELLVFSVSHFGQEW